jgi:hypothetical protein
MARASGAARARYRFIPPSRRIVPLTASALEESLLPACTAEVSDITFSELTGPMLSGLGCVRNHRDCMRSGFPIKRVVFKRADSLAKPAGEARRSGGYAPTTKVNRDEKKI